MTQRMVHCSIGASYPKTTDAIEYRNTERGSIDCNEVRGFTGWGECSWYEPNSGAAGEPDTSVARH